MVPREHGGRQPTWTGQGFARVVENSNLTFVVQDVFGTGHFNLAIRYELPDVRLFNCAFRNIQLSIFKNVPWDDVKITVIRPGDPRPDGPCANTLPSDDFLNARFERNSIYLKF